MIDEDEKYDHELHDMEIDQNMLNILKDDLAGFSTINHSAKNINSVVDKAKKNINKEKNSSNYSPNLY